ncbi:MAG: hypothetical protein ABI207_05810 [Crocinitomicaceae bacterium]
MNSIPQAIKSFLNANRVAAVCFNDENNKPYCINCFYVFDESHHTFLFKSSYNTFHEDYTGFVNPMAGSILPEKIDVLKMKGIQFTGKSLSEAEIVGLEMASVYYNKYPFGRVMPGYIWAIRPDFIKLTDNTLGIGNKTIWSVVPARVI